MLSSVFAERDSIEESLVSVKIIKSAPDCASRSKSLEFFGAGIKNFRIESYSKKYENLDHPHNDLSLIHI